MRLNFLHFNRQGHVDILLVGDIIRFAG